MSDKFQNAFADMFKKLDENHFRIMQRDTHLCSAKCCGDKGMSMESVQRCITNCSAPIASSQDFVSKEIQSLHERLDRCARDCRDSVNDKISGKYNSDMSMHQNEYEKCVNSCGDKFLKLLPNMLKKIEDFANENQAILEKMK